MQCKGTCGLETTPWPHLCHWCNRTRPWFLHPTGICNKKNKQINTSSPARMFQRPKLTRTSANSVHSSPNHRAPNMTSRTKHSSPACRRRSPWSGDHRYSHSPQSSLSSRFSCAPVASEFRCHWRNEASDPVRVHIRVDRMKMAPCYQWYYRRWRIQRCHHQSWAQSWQRLPPHGSCTDNVRGTHDPNPLPVSNAAAIQSCWRTQSHCLPAIK